ncbi:FMN-dependent NADH-azoreductase [Agrobacterium sp. DKPNP3]|uniref:FMN-dependent NADH-azoreductase n=1 Tax=Agrobacterium sp. DKPNP3 TaxID=3457323 RepID=UPI004044E1C5
MTNILLVTSSPRGSEGLSTRFSREIAEGLKARLGGSLMTRDLTSNPAPHIGQAYIQGRVAAPEKRTPEQVKAVTLAQELVEEVKAADVVVLGSSMINFGPSSQLKAWFDHITWPGVTFGYSEAGSPQGWLTGKKVYLVTAAGGVFSEGEWAAFDFQTGYLRHLLGFIGLTDVDIVSVEGTVFGPEPAKAAIAATDAQVRAVLEKAA